MIRSNETKKKIYQQQTMYLLIKMMNDQMEMKSKSKHQICQKHRHSTHHHFAMKI